MRRVGILLLLGLGLLTTAEARPLLVLILLRQGVAPQDLSPPAGTETDWIAHRTAWLLWGRVEPPQSLSRALSLATGRRLHAEPDDGLFLETATPFEHDTAGQAFKRRTGFETPPQALLAMNAGSLIRRGVLQMTLGAKLETIGLRGAYLRAADNTSTSPFLMLAMDKHGYVPIQTFTTQQELIERVPFLDAGWVIFEMDRWDYSALELMLAEGIETWIISLNPPIPGLSNAAMLTGVANYRAGKDREFSSSSENRTLLSSPTTRWSGLITEIDLVPAILHDLFPDRPTLIRSTRGTPVVTAGDELWHDFWNGKLLLRLVRSVPHKERRVYGGALSRVEEWWYMHHELAPVVLGMVGALGGLWIVVGLILWRLGLLWRWARRIYVSGLAVLSLFPAVTIWVSYCPVEMWTDQPARDASVVVGWMMLGWVLFSLVMAGLARWLQMTPLSGAAFTGLGVMLVDLYVGGGYGINRSLFGLYFWEGSRLYGLDNSYLGVIIVYGVLGVAGWMQARAEDRLRDGRLILVMTLYGFLILTLGFPLLGADAGGIAAAIVAFGTAGHLYASRRLKIRYIVALFALGVLSTFAMMWLDSKLPWQWRSHLGRAWDALMQENDWVTILSSKWRVMVRVAISPALWAALFGLGLGFGGAFLWMRELLTGFWDRAMALRKGIMACLWGTVASVLFNDSGIVTACLIAGGVVLWTLEYLIGGKDWGYPTGNGKTTVKL